MRDVRLDFREGDEARRWTSLIGENGLGKTSVLRAIVMASDGAQRSNQLADVPSLIDRRAEG